MPATDIEGGAAALRRMPPNWMDLVTGKLLRALEKRAAQLSSHPPDGGPPASHPTKSPLVRTDAWEACKDKTEDGGREDQAKVSQLCSRGSSVRVFLTLARRVSAGRRARWRERGPQENCEGGAKGEEDYVGGGEAD